MTQYPIQVVGPVIIVDSSGTPIPIAGNVTSLSNISIVAGQNVDPTLAGNRTHGQQTVGNVTPTQLFAASASKLSRQVENLGNVTVYVGNASVSSANGYPVTAGSIYSEQNTTAALNAISGAGNVTVAIMGRDP